MTDTVAGYATTRPIGARMVRAMINLRLRIDQEVAVVAARDLPGIGHLRALETAGTLTLGVMPDRGDIETWLDSLFAIDKTALARPPVRWGSRNGSRRRHR